MPSTGWWLVAEIAVTFFAGGAFFSWLAFSILRLRRSNHDIRNSLHKIALMMEFEHGRSPLDDDDGQRGV